MYTRIPTTVPVAHRHTGTRVYTHNHTGTHEYECTCINMYDSYVLYSTCVYVVHVCHVCHVHMCTQVSEV